MAPNSKWLSVPSQLLPVFPGHRRGGSGFPMSLEEEVRSQAKPRSVGAMKGIRVRRHTDITWPSGPDFHLQSGASSGRMRHRNALVSNARQRHLDSCSRRCPDGRARYDYRVDICVAKLPTVPAGTAGGTKRTFLPCLKPLSTTPPPDRS